MPFICLDNHWLIHEVFNGVVSTTRQWWSGTGISDCFFKAWGAISQRCRDHHGTVFLLWSTFLITEHKIAKKSLKLSNMTSTEYSTQCHLMFQRRLFLILILWRQEELLMSGSASWPDVFFEKRKKKQHCLRLDWQMLECFALSDFLRGLWTVHTHHTNPCLRWKKPNEEERRRMIVVAINPPQVKSRKGRWLRKRRIPVSTSGKQVQVIAVVKTLVGYVWLVDFSVLAEGRRFDSVSQQDDYVNFHVLMAVLTRCMK